MHETTFEYLKPTDDQAATMNQARQAAATYCRELDRLLPDGPDKTFIIRALCTNAMWANVALTRNADGSPRT